jgi:hypothetical protein
LDTSAFAIAESCDDEAWTYTAEWQKQSDSSIVVTEAFTATDYSISTSDTSLIDVYNVFLYGEMPDG